MKLDCFSRASRTALVMAVALAATPSIAQTGAENALVATHRGVIRALAVHLLGEPLAKPPELGEIVSFTRDGERWFLGRRGSNPPALGAAA